MRKKTIRITVWIAIASALAGCASGTARLEYRPVPLSEIEDPLVQAKNFTPWRPPRQMAAFIHPHEDREQGIMIAGHWIMVLLGEGSWYFQDDVDREPVPDGEAGADDVRAALGAVSVPRDAVIPYRPKEGAKP
ncbi:MAG TPA: hypothetical protein VKU80_13260 [Planctomycetota bacterium]|nr:hypothetical protein [Planctomycetota bacterium]